MKPPLTYYGGKQRLAERILAMSPPHEIYCEPFFGGGAVFFRKYKSAVEVINDHDNDLINFYSCVQGRFDELEALVQQTLCSETMYRHAKDIWNARVESSDVERAWAVWLITNGSYGGSMHGGWKWCNGVSGSHAGVYLNIKRNLFSRRLKERLSEVQICCRDALDVIGDRDTSRTFFYLDPPYPGCYQQHYSGYTVKDLARLLDLLSGIKGKFILSNYWSQTLKFHVIKNGWNYRVIEMPLIASRDRGRTRNEVLVYNYITEPSLFDGQWKI
ncbi:MAG: DNA adenine methylase [Odoribacteraceae bacterium]|jgi:DNA adenine methylase|nr:DNA adenine methylase [Odoribacteraceae bacterium]